MNHGKALQLTNERSEQFSSRSCKRKELPCASRESLSISPNRIPPALFLPCTGWWVRISTGPVVRTWRNRDTKQLVYHSLIAWWIDPLLLVSHLVPCILSCLVPGICLPPCVSVAGSTRLQRKRQPRIPCHQCHCTNAHCQNSCNQLQKNKTCCVKKLEMGSRFWIKADVTRWSMLMQQLLESLWVALQCLPFNLELLVLRLRVQVHE